jgi:nicotinate-nucleotide--dimethylbenzimidazole phosphoribosyltransferase
VISPPSSGVYVEARRRLDALAKPLGALGRLEHLAAWVSACQATCPPRPLDRVRAVILAGDHGVSHDGVSAYPREVTPVMVQAFVAGVAGANWVSMTILMTYQPRFRRTTSGPPSRSTGPTP